MSDRETSNVTMRVRVGDSEIEVTGPASFVEQKIKEFVERLPQASRERTSQIPEDDQPQSPNGGEAKKTSVAQFFKKVRAKSDLDRALAAGYYLEKYANAQSFTSTEIAETIRTGAKVPPPKNPSDAMSKNIKKGLMMNAGDKDGRMAFVLTSDGEEAILNMLQQQ